MLIYTAEYDNVPTNGNVGADHGINCDFGPQNWNERQSFALPGDTTLIDVSVFVVTAANAAVVYSGGGDADTPSAIYLQVIAMPSFSNVDDIAE